MNTINALRQCMSLPFLAAFVGFALLTTGCDNVDANTEGDHQIHALTVDDIEFTNTVPVVGKNGKTEYRFEIGLRPSPWRSRIGGLQMLARSKGGKPILLVDDGTGADKKARDGIYSARIPDSCIPLTGRESGGPRTGKALEIDCTIHFVGPGENCMGWGECPRREKRSLFFGLIEYETSIVVCFCIDKCTISF